MSRECLLAHAVTNVPQLGKKRNQYEWFRLKECWSVMELRKLLRPEIRWGRKPIRHISTVLWNLISQRMRLNLDNPSYLCRCITSTRHKSSHIWREGQRHDVPGVASVGGGLLACLDVPQSARRRIGLETKLPKTASHFTGLGKSIRLTRSCLRCSSLSGCHQGTCSNWDNQCGQVTHGSRVHSLHGSSN